MLITDSPDFRTKNIITNRDKHFIIDKGVVSSRRHTINTKRVCTYQQSVKL